MLRPPWSRLAIPVTCPAAAARWWVALISMPTVTRSGPACSAEPSEPSVSASTHDAPPCSSPSGWVLPATGMVPTTRRAVASRILIPIWSMSVSLLRAMYSSVIRCALSWSTATSGPAAPPAAGGSLGRPAGSGPGGGPGEAARHAAPYRRAGVVAGRCGNGCAPPPGEAAGRQAPRWSASAELEDGCRVEGLSCLQDGGWEVRLVRRVREVLGLERVTRRLPVGVAADADQVPVEEVAGVELDTRLIGPHDQHAPAARVRGRGGEPEPGERRAGMAQHPVVVVAVREDQLVALGRARVADPGSDGVEGPEVERRARDWHDRAGRDQVGVSRRERPRVDEDLLGVGRPRCLPGQVEVGVVGQVDNGRQLRVIVVRAVPDPDPVAIVEGVGDVRRDLGREAGARARRWRDRAVRLKVLGARQLAAALVTVGGDELHRQRDAAVAARRGRVLPDAVTPADESAVQRVRPVVDRQCVGRPVELERGSPDPVGVPADGLAKVGTAKPWRPWWRAVQVHVLLQRLEAECDVLEVAMPVGDPDRLHRGAVGHDPYLHAMAVGQRVAPYRLIAAVRPRVRGAEVDPCDGRLAVRAPRRRG